MWLKLHHVFGEKVTACLGWIFNSHPLVGKITVPCNAHLLKNQLVKNK